MIPTGIHWVLFFQIPINLYAYCAQGCGFKLVAIISVELFLHSLHKFPTENF